MKIDSKLCKMLNNQANHERFNETFYLAAAAYFDSLDLEGMSSYFILHAEEEKSHFQRFYNYINENGGNVEITGIEDPKELINFKSVTDVFIKAVQAEELTSRKIRELNTYADSINDYRAMKFINTFEDEQQEEEDLWNYNLSRAKLCEKDMAALIKFDEEMALRKICGAKKQINRKHNG